MGIFQSKMKVTLSTDETVTPTNPPRTTKLKKMLSFRSMSASKASGEEAKAVTNTNITETTDEKQDPPKSDLNSSKLTPKLNDSNDANSKPKSLENGDIIVKDGHDSLPTVEPTEQKMEEGEGSEKTLESCEEDKNLCGVNKSENDIFTDDTIAEKSVEKCEDRKEKEEGEVGDVSTTASDEDEKAMAHHSPPQLPQTSEESSESNKSKSSIEDEEIEKDESNLENKKDSDDRPKDVDSSVSSNSTKSGEEDTNEDDLQHLPTPPPSLLTTTTTEEEEQEEEGEDEKSVSVSEKNKNVTDNGSSVD